MFIVDRWTLPLVTSSSIEIITWSDHAPITLRLSGQGTSKGNPLWRLNTYLLSISEHSQAIEKALNSYFEFNDTNEVSKFSIWTAHKAYARGMLI